MRPTGFMPNGPRLTMPTGVKVRGLQIQRTVETPLMSDPRIVRDGFWPTNNEFWADWPWTTIIKPQIDLACAMGANTLKFFCSVHGIELGFYTRATHEARLVQALDYMQSKGVLVYMAVYFYGSEGAPDPRSNATIEAELVHAMSVIARYPNVIGIDCGNELAWWELISWCRPRFKAVAPNLPLTISAIASGPAGWMSAPPTLAPYVDFYDFHPYYGGGTLPVPADLAEFRASPYYKPWLIGEVGASATFWDAVNVLSQEPDCFGWVAYSTYDCTLSFQIANTDGTIVTPDRLAAFQRGPQWPQKAHTV